MQVLPGVELLILRERMYVIFRATRQPLLVEAELGATILLPARLVLFCAELLFLAIADGANTAGVDTGLNQSGLGRVGAILTECQVVLCRSAIVTISGDQDLGIWMRLQEGCVLSNGGLGIGANGVGVVIEEDRLDVLLEFRLRQRSRGGCWRCCLAHGQGRCGIGRSAIAARNQVVGCGVGGADGLGAAGLDGADSINRDIGRVGGCPVEGCTLSRSDGVRSDGDVGGGSGGGFSRGAGGSGAAASLWWQPVVNRKTASAAHASAEFFL